MNANVGHAEFAFVTPHGEMRRSVRAIGARAIEDVAKPFEPDLMGRGVQSAVQRSALRADTPGDNDGSGLGIIGRGARLRRVMEDVAKVATTDATVLVRGETGTGKELVARAVHVQSKRSGPFVKLNCAAVPANLLESELMGHEKGAFTGAFSRRIGRFEAAQNGTLFLDEVGEMPLELQPKLLRLLQEREFERLGSNQTIRSNARVIAATNRDLGAMVAQQQFREDLFYRLNVFPVELPPLRERRDDIPALAQYFANAFGVRTGRHLEPLSAEFIDRLCAHAWPGNIRELMNVVERAAILATNGSLPLSALGSLGPAVRVPDQPRYTSPPGPVGAPGSGSPGASTESERLEDVDRQHILAVLNAAHWVIGGPHGAAARLGMKRPTLHFRMKKLGIERNTGETIR
jgi:transcriptional regulator with GAF, ATPase, and Fis domain